MSGTEPPLALVTGANRGLGLECARQLLSHGFTVLLGSRDPGRGASVSAEEASLTGWTSAG